MGVFEEISTVEVALTVVIISMNRIEVKDLYSYIAFVALEFVILLGR